ncbi:MAG: glycosyl transferase [Desulfuromonas sp.]|nr:MAG: glycosyl transferase [Desulfuromonas sp.]
MAVELSIIVPIYNEEEQIPCLLTDLIRQQQVEFELLLVDGGSRDGGLACANERREQLPYPLRIIEAEKGRGRQLNTGATAASADWLLFLHVDSRFDDPLALRKGMDRLSANGTDCAGHFSLRFRRSQHGAEFGYYFHEWKARLGRPECIHGDQGMLLRRDLFDRVGPFRTDLPVMEDTDFAERLRQQHGWLLLPEQISTSARRFEREGFKQRQFVSALIMNFRNADWIDFFSGDHPVYLSHTESGRLQLLPFLQQVRQRLSRQSPADRRELWARSGHYVRSHAWQLFFFLDAKRAFRRGRGPGQGRLFWLRLLEPGFTLLTDNPLGRALATILLRIWFWWTCLIVRWRERRDVSV